MRPSSLSLSSSLPSTDNPSRYPSFLVSVLIERTFVPSSVSRNCARKNISSGRRLDIVISRACRIGNGSMFRRRLRRDGRIELRSSTGTFPTGGTNFPVESPGGFTATPAIRVQISHPRLAIRSPFDSKNLGGSLAPSKWMARVRRRGEALAELRNTPRTLAPLYFSLDGRERRIVKEEEGGGRGRERRRGGRGGV